jgi:hypothetical protein
MTIAMRQVLRKCSEIARSFSAKLFVFWSGRPGSNRRHPAWEAGVLPLNYSRIRLDNQHLIIPAFASGEQWDER